MQGILTLRYAIHSPNTELKNVQPGVIDLTKIRPEVYSSYPKNEHHWTTKWVWDHFIPRIASDLGISFSSSDFTLVPCSFDQQDLSYHIPHNDTSIQIGELGSTSCQTLKISELIFNKNFTSPFGATTGYHKLFLYSHRCCWIFNQASKTERSLILNTDSMSVPVIPALIPYFRNMLVLDNRTGTSFKKKIADFISKHFSTLSYVELFIADSYNFHKYAINLK